MKTVQRKGTTQHKGRDEWQGLTVQRKERDERKGLAVRRKGRDNED